MRSVITQSGGLAAQNGQISSGTPIAISPGSTGDHLLVPELLHSAGVTYSEDAFLSRLDEPSYEPTDRLVVRERGKLLAHAQTLFRDVWFGDSLLPCGGVVDFAVVPELKNTNIEFQVLHAAEEALRRGGALVAFTHTTRRDLLKRAGWLEVDSQGASRVHVHHLLSQLSPKATRLRRRVRSQVRIWRRVELEELMPVYQSAAQTTWGTIDRSEVYWRWLWGSYADCTVLVACNNASSQQAEKNILGYAVVHGDQILEMRYRPGHESAGSLLLARICRDSIEQDRRELTLQAPANDPLHELIITAGGSWITPDNKQDECFMMKLLNPEKWVQAMNSHWRSRLVQSRLPLPLALNFSVDNHPYKLSVSNLSARLQTTTTHSNEIVCQSDVFGALLLGCQDVRQLMNCNKVVVKNNQLKQQLEELFTSVIYWQSPLDWNS